MQVVTIAEQSNEVVFTFVDGVAVGGGRLHGNYSEVAASEIGVHPPTEGDSGIRQASFWDSPSRRMRDFTYSPKRFAIRGLSKKKCCILLKMN